MYDTFGLSDDFSRHSWRGVHSVHLSPPRSGLASEVHRGEILGALLGAAHGAAGIPEELPQPPATRFISSPTEVKDGERIRQCWCRNGVTVAPPLFQTLFGVQAVSATTFPAGEVEAGAQVPRAD